MALSNLERAVAVALEERNIPYQRRYGIPQMPHRKFDFFFTRNKRNYLIECDGIQHFQEVPYFVARGGDLASRQQVDRLKTKVAVDYGYHLIRIDYTCEDCAERHLMLALNRIERRKQCHYFSTESLYTYLDVPLDKQMIIRECQDLARLLKYI